VSRPGTSGVSRETSHKLDIYDRELRKWQRVLNLVSPASLSHVWRRHIEDCLQLVHLHPDAQAWIDLGSGAGLPGLIIAARDVAPAVLLIESDRRKCAFLRSTAAAMGVAVSVREDRIEAAVPTLAVQEQTVVTARALAPLHRLLLYAQPLLLQGAVGLFPKGRTYSSELTLARESWRFDAEVIPSRTHPDGRVIRITRFQGSRS